MSASNLQSDNAILWDMVEKFLQGHFSEGPESAQLNQWNASAVREALELGLLDCALPAESGGIELALAHQITLIQAASRASAAFGCTLAVHLAVVQTFHQAGLSSQLPTINQAAKDRQQRPLLGIAVQSLFAGRVDQADQNHGDFITLLPLEQCTCLLIADRNDNALRMLTAAEMPTDNDKAFCGSGLEQLQLSQILDTVSGQSITGVSANDLLDNLQLFLAAAQTGNAHAAIEQAMAYTAERKQTGRAIQEHQNVRAILMRNAVQLNAAAAFVDHTANREDRQKGAYNLCRQSYVFSGEVAEQCCLDAIQTLGGYGYMKDYGLEKRLRDCKTMQSLCADHYFSALGIRPSVH